MASYVKLMFPPTVEDTDREVEVLFPQVPSEGELVVMVDGDVEREWTVRHVQYVVEFDMCTKARVMLR